MPIFRILWGAMIDHYGLVVQENGDGGDCPCRTGVVIGSAIAKSNPISVSAGVSMFSAFENVCHPESGYIRHPVIYNDPKDFSRDQASRLFLGYGICMYSHVANAYYGRLMANKLRHPNGDPLGLSEIMALIRMNNLWILWPMLFLLDLKFFVDIVSWRWKPWDTDNLFVMDLWYAKNKFWTPSAWLAAKLYNKATAAVRIKNNLNSGDPGLTCVEAYEANMWFLNNL